MQKNSTICCITAKYLIELKLDWGNSKISQYFGNRPQHNYSTDSRSCLFMINFAGKFCEIGDANESIKVYFQLKHLQIGNLRLNRNNLGSSG